MTDKTCKLFLSKVETFASMEKVDKKYKFKVPPHHENKRLSDAYCEIVATLPFITSQGLERGHNMPVNQDLLSSVNNNFQLLEAAGPGFWKMHMNSVQNPESTKPEQLFKMLKHMFSVDEQQRQQFTKSKLAKDEQVASLLPWQPALLHTWLYIVWSQLLEIKEISIWFALWPMPLETAELAGKILVMLREIEKQITYGFLLLGEITKTYPKVRGHVCRKIMEHVVEPLQYFVQRDFSILKELCMQMSTYVVERNRPWEKNDVFVNPKNYLISSRFDDFAHLHSLAFWLSDDANKAQFFGKVKLNKFSKRLRKGPVYVPVRNYTRHLYKWDLSCSADAMQKINEFHRTPDYCVSLSDIDCDTEFLNMIDYQTRCGLPSHIFSSQIIICCTIIKVNDYLRKKLDDPSSTFPIEHGADFDELGGTWRRNFEGLTLQHIKEQREKFVDSKKKTPTESNPFMTKDSRGTDSVIMQILERVHLLDKRITEHARANIDSMRPVYPGMAFIKLILPKVTSTLLNGEFGDLYRRRKFLKMFMHNFLDDEEKAFEKFVEARKTHQNVEVTLEASQIVTHANCFTDLVDLIFPCNLGDPIKLYYAVETQKEVPPEVPQGEFLQQEKLNLYRWSRMQTGICKKLSSAVISRAKNSLGVSARSLVFSMEVLDLLGLHQIDPIQYNISALELKHCVFGITLGSIYDIKDVLRAHRTYSKSMWEDILDRVQGKCMRLAWSLSEVAVDERIDVKHPAYDELIFANGLVRETIESMPQGWTSFKFAFIAMTREDEAEGAASRSRERPSISDVQWDVNWIAGCKGSWEKTYTFTNQVCRMCAEHRKPVYMCTLCEADSDYPDLNMFCSENCEAQALPAGHSKEHNSYAASKLNVGLEELTIEDEQQH